MCIKSRKYQSYRACADELLHITRGLSARCSWSAEETAAESDFCTTCFLDQSKERPVVWLTCWGSLSPLLRQDGLRAARPGEAAAESGRLLPPTRILQPKACSFGAAREKGSRERAVRHAALRGCEEPCSSTFSIFFYCDFNIYVALKGKKKLGSDPVDVSISV